MTSKSLGSRLSFLGLAFLVLAGCGSGNTVGTNDISFSGYDTDEDVGDVVVCAVNDDCNDNNPCTENLCNAWGFCEYGVLEGLGCDDGNGCTEAETCSARGICEGGTQVTCDDGKACTSDTCIAAQGCVFTPLDKAGECDGSLCTIGDACQDGTCVPGDVVECQDSNSDDCRFNSCDAKAGKCTVQLLRPEGHNCKDGNPCSTKDLCDDAGLCVGGDEYQCVASNPCMKARCNELGKEDGSNPCIYEWRQPGTGCDDSDACTENDSCQGDAQLLVCQGAAVDCDDQNPCTTDSCDEASGCFYLQKNDNSPCNLGAEYCNGLGHCLEGQCVSDTPADCDDGINCTRDSCLEGGVCKHEPLHEVCDDGLFCNGVEVCDINSGCKRLEVSALDDGVDCTADSCDENNDEMVHQIMNGFCDNGDACDGAEFCDPSAGCKKGLPPTCNDGVTCTADSCDQLEGCINTPSDADCDDNSPCTTDLCVPGAGGCVHAALEGTHEGWRCCKTDEQCQDGEPCTVDVCVKDAAFCTASLLDDGTPCNDGLACITDEACAAGVCTGAEAQCDDDVDCTLDYCGEPGGCVNEPKDSVCDDQDVCNGLEYCAPGVGGGCKIRNIPKCDDDINCTVDSCDPLDGCSNVETAALCDDGIDCTLDACSAQSGCYHQARDSMCTDNNVCTGIDYCAAGLEGGCKIKNIPNCDDGQACTADSCDPLKGCANLPVDANCLDAVACTVDTCDPAKGCINKATNTLCDDLIPCTLDTCSATEGCKHTLGTNNCFIDAVCYTGGDTDDSGCLVCTPPTDASAWTPANGGPCDDGNDATAQDLCVGGLCMGLPDQDLDGVASAGFDISCTGGDVLECTDNCPSVPNRSQADSDGDGVGDVCDGWGRDFVLYEPCLAPSAPHATGDCDPYDVAWGAGLSGSVRRNELVTVPLTNGYLDQSLLALWRFGNNNFNDCSYAGRTATLDGNGTLVEDPFGDPIGAFKPNSGSSLSTTLKVVPTQTTEVSFSAWVRLKENCGSVCKGYVVGRSSVDGREDLGLEVGTYNGAPYPYFKVRTVSDAYTDDCTIRAKAALNDGKWHHVAGVWDRGLTTLWVDGLSQGSKRCALDIGRGNNETLRISAAGGAVTGKLDAEVDEVAVFSRALTRGDIKAIHDSLAPYGSQLAPQAQTDFDDLRLKEFRIVNQLSPEVAAEVLGPRVHSDSACPASPEADTLKDREDLCNVAAYMPLDGNAQDRVNAGNPGGLVGPVAAVGRFGVANSAYYFDGTSYVDFEIDSTPNLRPNKALTVEVWVWADGQAASNGCLVDIEEGGGWGLCLDVDLKPYFNVSNFENGFSVKATQALVKGTWHHLAAVVDTGEVSLWVDGLKVASSAVAVGTISYPSSVDLHLGNNPSLSGPHLSYFKGYLDEVLIHKVAKSPEYLYRRGRPGVPVLRFLANTESTAVGSGAYPYRVYRLLWGDEALMKPVVVTDTRNLNGGKPCWGLPSACNGFRAWWRFDEYRSGVSVDTSTYKINGAYQSDPPETENAEDPGLTLDGQSQYFTAASAPKLEAGGTIEILARPASCGQRMTLVSRDTTTSGQAAWVLGINATTGGGWCVPFFESQGKRVELPAFSANAWMQVLVRVSGTMAYLSVNHGAFKAELAMSVAGESGVLRVGSSQMNDEGLPAIGDFFHGLVDSVKIGQPDPLATELIHHPVTRVLNPGYTCTGGCCR
jgi:hypothetical protein